MKRHHRGFNFRGFVALADLIFAVSAGLLLLNPVQFDDAPADEAAAQATPGAILSNIEKVDGPLREIETQVQQLRNVAREILKNEQK